jgi:cholesterol oxidase
VQGFVLSLENAASAFLFRPPSDKLGVTSPPEQPMERLSSPIESLKPHYEIVVIGSGYGGGIAASRLARAGRQVAVVERGREIQSGDYPNHATALLKEVQADVRGVQIGSSTALFDFRFNDDMNAIVGCGLGGTSLINANISLAPEPRIFEDPVWPEAVRQDARSGVLEPFFQYALDMLGAAPFPSQMPESPKMKAFTSAARRLNLQVSRPPINVTFQAGPNAAGVEQSACVGCGDCVSGCNYNAKNTVLMNYLPDAKRHGTEIFTRMCARSIVRTEHGWNVLFDESRSVAADMIILAAGTLGSTEVLLRSAAQGLPLSNALGTRFSGNGDMIGITFNAEEPINSIGLGDRSVEGREPVGPCSTVFIDHRNQPDLDEGKVIMDSAIPGALGPFLAKALAVGLVLTGTRAERGPLAWLNAKCRELASVVFGPYAGAVHNSLNYLVVSHDDSGGTMYLENDKLRISWPGAGRSAAMRQAADVIRQASEALAGDFVPDPVWNRFTDRQLITGHPLGGCVMGESADNAVVNHQGKVFSGATGTSVHEGLYVMDGAVIPRSLGVNPLLTISALAERSCSLTAAEHGWTIPYGPPAGDRP